MNILMITPYLPYPPESGGQTRSYHLLTRLSKNHNITLCCYYRREKEKKYIDKLKPYASKIIMVKRRPAFHPLHFFLGLFTTMPFLLISTYLSFGLRKAVAQELNDTKYDLVHCETFYVLPNVPKTSVPLVLVEQTVEYFVYKHFVNKLKIPLVSFLLSFELSKLLSWEKKSWQLAARILTVSHEDMETIVKLDHRQKDKIDVVPNGVDTRLFIEEKQEKKYDLKNPTFCYVGNFKWLQNKEALGYLMTHIFPVLKKLYPTCRLVVAGMHIPTEYMVTDPQVSYFESIPDIRDVYRQVDVLLAPIFGPGGTRLKILEAMASKTLVMTTPTGAMGLNIQDGKEVLMFETVEELKHKLHKVLSNEKFFNSLIKGAYEKVRKEYDWDSIVKKLENNYKKVVHGK